MGPGEAMLGMTFFISFAAVLILRGPLGKAMADRLAGRTGAEESVARRQVERLEGELEDVRHRLSEAEDRLDFAERLLAKHREQSALGPGN
jgi:hypothetical protein